MVNQSPKEYDIYWDESMDCVPSKSKTVQIDHGGTSPSNKVDEHDFGCLSEDRVNGDEREDTGCRDDEDEDHNDDTQMYREDATLPNGNHGDDDSNHFLHEADEPVEKGLLPNDSVEVRNEEELDTPKDSLEEDVEDNAGTNHIDGSKLVCDEKKGSHPSKKNDSVNQTATENHSSMKSPSSSLLKRQGSSVSFFKRVTTLPSAPVQKTRGVAFRRHRSAHPTATSHQKQQPASYKLKSSLRSNPASNVTGTVTTLANSADEEKSEFVGTCKVNDDHPSTNGKGDDTTQVATSSDSEQDEKNAKGVTFSIEDAEPKQLDSTFQDASDQKKTTQTTVNKNFSKDLENLSDEPLVMRKARTTLARNAPLLHRLNPRLSTKKIDGHDPTDNHDIATAESPTKEVTEADQLNVTKEETEDDGQNDPKQDESELNFKEEIEIADDCHDQTSKEKKFFRIRSTDSADNYSMASAKTQKISNRRFMFPSPFRNQRSTRRRDTPVKKLPPTSPNDSKNGLTFKIKQGLK